MVWLDDRKFEDKILAGINEKGAENPTVQLRVLHVEG